MFTRIGPFFRAFRHVGFLSSLGRVKLVGLGLAGVTCLLIQTGCVVIPSAQLVSTPAPTTAPEQPCTANFVAAAPASGVQPTTPAGKMLSTTFDEVRHATIFATPDFDYKFVNVKGVLDEANGLVTKAQAVAASKATPPTPIPDTLKISDVENVLIANLPPWASQKASLLPPIGTNVEEVIKNAFDVITAIADKQNDSSQTALIPAAARKGTAGAPVATSDAQPTSSSGHPTLAFFSWVKHDQLIQDLHALSAYRAFHQLTLLSAAHIEVMLDAPTPPSQAALDSEVRIFNLGKFLSTYFDAYFRGGEIVQFNANEQALLAAVSTDLQPKIKGGMSQAQLQNLLQQAYDGICTGPNKTALCSAQLGQSAFVTRAGMSIQFSGFDYSVTTTKGLGISGTAPQANQYGPQLVRVLVEAIYDANGLVPLGVPNSTACKQGLFPTDECLPSNASADVQANLQQIDTYSAIAEALSSTATGAVIRGIDGGALNNETVAQSIETLMGEIARKITEKTLAATIGSNSPVQCPVKPVSMKVEQGPRI